MRVTRILVGQATLHVPRKQGDVYVSLADITIRGAEQSSGACYTISLRELVRHLQSTGCIQWDLITTVDAPIPSERLI